MTHDMSRPATPEEEQDILHSPEYTPWILGEYYYWTLYLNARDQGIIGRSYIWLHTRHIDRMSMTQLTRVEQMEFFQVLEKYEWAVRQLFGDTLLTVNVEWLGNETHLHRGHGHAHLTPRFREKVEFDGLFFIDQNPGGRANNVPLRLPPTQLLEIRNALWRKLREWRPASVLL